MTDSRTSKERVLASVDAGTVAFKKHFKRDPQDDSDFVFIDGYATALRDGATVEPSAGVKCTHCNGTGYSEPIYDEQDGWIDETPCETCDGSGRITTVEQYLKTLPANWHEDSSLETWFPIAAEELKRLKDARATVPPSASDEFPADCDVIDITCDEDDERVIEFVFVRDDICVKGQSVTKDAPPPPPQPPPKRVIGEYAPGFRPRDADECTAFS